MLLKLETNLSSIVWKPHIVPDVSFQIPSTTMNPSNNHALSDYCIIQPIITPMAIRTENYDETIYIYIYSTHLPQFFSS